MNFKKFKWKIVNGRVESFKRYKEAGLDAYGLPVHIDDYGMGASHWPLLERKEDQEKVQRIHNITWAADRMKWAKDNAKSEMPYLLKVLQTGVR